MQKRSIAVRDGTMKTCSKCKEAKPLSAFHKNQTQSDGLHTYCKICANAYCKQYQQKNEELLKQYHQSQTCKDSRRRYRKEVRENETHE